MHSDSRAPFSLQSQEVDRRTRWSHPALWVTSHPSVVTVTVIIGWKEQGPVRTGATMARNRDIGTDGVLWDYYGIDQNQALRLVHLSTSRTVLDFQFESHLQL